MSSSASASAAAGVGQQASQPSADVMRAASLEAERIKKETRHDYTLKLKQISAYFKSTNYTGSAIEIDLEGLPVVPLPLSAMRSFFGHKTKKREELLAHMIDEAAKAKKQPAVWPAESYVAFL